MAWGRPVDRRQMRADSMMPDDDDATLSITLRPTPEGTLRVITGSGTSYDLTVWAVVLRDLADEFDRSEIQYELDEAEIKLSPFAPVPAEA